MAIAGANSEYYRKAALQKKLDEFPKTVEDWRKLKQEAVYEVDERVDNV